MSTGVSPAAAASGWTCTVKSQGDNPTPMLDGCKILTSPAGGGQGVFTVQLTHVFSGPLCGDSYTLGCVDSINGGNGSPDTNQLVCPFYSGPAGGLALGRNAVDKSRLSGTGFTCTETMDTRLAGENTMSFYENKAVQVPQGLPGQLYIASYQSGTIFQIVQGTGSPPVAHMNWSADGVAPYEFTFDGSPSTASDGATIVSYHWDFGDGTTADTTAPTATVVHRFTSEGDKQVTLTVTDSQGQTASDTETVGGSLRVEQVVFDPSVIRPHTAVHAVVTLQNDGTSTLHGVVASMATDKATVMAPGTAPGAQDIQPATSAEFTFPVQAGSDGQAVLTVAGQGTTSSGATVSAQPKQRNATVGNPGLLVDLAGEHPNPNDDFSVKVTLTNPGADDVTGITYNDPSGIVEADVSPATGVAKLLTAANTPPSVLHGGQSVALTYAFHAGANGSAVFTSQATGTTRDDVNGGTKTVTDTTSLSVTVSDNVPTPAALDDAARAAWDLAGQILAGSHQDTQNILAGAITETGVPAPTEGDYEAIRESGLSPGLAALAKDPKGLDAFGEAYAEQVRNLTNQGAAGLGKDMVAVYTAAKDPQTWSAMASAAYQAMKALPSSALTNAGYLGTAIVSSSSPQGVVKGLSDTVSAGESAATALRTAAVNAKTALDAEVKSLGQLAGSDPEAFYKKLGELTANAEVVTTAVALNLAVGGGVMKAGQPALSSLASRVGLRAMVSAGTEATLDASAATADTEAVGTMLSQGAAVGTGSGPTDLKALDGAVSQFQRLEAGATITSTDASALGGILPSDQAQLNGILQSTETKFGIPMEIGVRTSEPLSLGLDVSPKPELIKPKAVSVLDQLMGAPTDAAGRSTVFDPVPLSADQIAAYEAQSPGFTAAYESRLASQQKLYKEYKDGNNLSKLVDASKATNPDGTLRYPNGITAIVDRPQPLGSFTRPANLIYLEQLDDPAYLAANNMSTTYAQGLKQEMLQSYPGLMKVQINTIERADGSVTFIDGLKNRPYGSDMDIQYIRPANGAPWPPGERTQIETYVNSQLKKLARFPNHGASDAANDLNSTYYAAAAKFQMGNVNPAVAEMQAQAIYDRYGFTSALMERAAARLTAMADAEADPTRKALLLAEAANLQKSAVKMEAITYDEILGYGNGEKILIFRPGDIRVGYTPLLKAAARLGPPAPASAARIVLASAPLTPAPTPATTFTVDSLTDAPAPMNGSCETGGNGCTLREAFAEATAAQIPVTITLPAGTITLTSGPLTTNDTDITLTGSGTGTGTGTGTTIDGAATTDIIQTTRGSLTVTGLTLANGLTAGDDAVPGGAISADGTAVTLTDTVVSHSRSDGPGGGVWVGDGGSLTLLRATFTDDQGSLGGAISVADSALNVTASTFDGNGTDQDGGAIHAADLPSLAITATTFTDDVAGRRGGAVFVADAEGPVTFTGDTFTGSSSSAEGGAIDVAGLTSRLLTQQTLVIHGGTFTGNQGTAGGAIAADTAPATIDGATFDGNNATVTDGGAIATSGPLTVSSSTFSGNTAQRDGGAIAAGAVTTLSGVTFRDNASQGLAGAVALLAPVADSFSGTTFSGNSAAAAGADVWLNGGTLATDKALGPTLYVSQNGQQAASTGSGTTGTGTTGTGAGDGTTGSASTSGSTGAPSTESAPTTSPTPTSPSASSTSPHSGGSLAFTGSTILPVIELGLALLALGIASILLIDRRHGRPRPSRSQR